MQTTEENYIGGCQKIFHQYKTMADKAMLQVSDAAFHRQYDEESNSLALVIQHIAGNMLSRWTDFYTSDGEKENRNRDGEFVDALMNRNELLAFWEKGWQCCFQIIDTLKPEDLNRIITIRNEPHTVIDAVNRQIAHYAYHVGQIVYICKMYRQEDWQTLSIARNKSAEFNVKMKQGN